MLNIIIDAVIVLVFIGIAVGRYPLFRLNRATIAFVGAAILIALKAISLEEAYGAIDLNTLALILSMMMINANMKFAGFFLLAGKKLLIFARRPKILLLVIILVSGILSAFFLNDTVVLMFTPLVLQAVLSLGRDPVPYLVGLATAANIGSMATIIGNPQNMLIGSASGIPFFRFSMFLAVPAAAGLFVAWIVIVLVFSKEFKAQGKVAVEGRPVPIYKPLLIKSIIALVLLMILVSLGTQVAYAALMAAALLLFTRRIKPERVMRELDISLIVLFSGLFIITEAIHRNPLFQSLFNERTLALLEGPGMLSLISAALRNLVSNVPAVMLLRHVIPGMPDPEQAWLVLAMATTLAGNFTLLGSVANLIVAESAKRGGVTLSFGAYFKAGAPITVITIALGVLWFSLVF